MGKENIKHIKLAIASKAAELISQEGIRDYHFAKKKAAKYLGFSDKEILPSNYEIDKELILFKNLYQKVDHDLVQNLKKEALKIMILLERFKPFISNQFLEGIITKYPVIEINLFTDDIKEIEYILLNQNIHFEIIDVNIQKKHASKNITIYKIDGYEFPIELKIFDINEIKIQNKQILKARGLSIKELKNFDPSDFAEEF
jgi:hypothetical protein